MRSRPSQRGCSPLSGVAIALLAAFCAAPSRAEAGCSHYVVAGQHADEPLLRLDIFNPSTAAAVAAEAPVRPKPCTGALCSGKPAVPLPVPITASVSRAEQWGEMMPPSSLPTTGGRLLTVAEPIVRAVIEEPSIERPPR